MPRIEGDKRSEWVAIDLGNIVLHIMDRTTREKYDIETLWCVGAKFDPESNKVDPMSELISQHTYELNGRHDLKRNLRKYVPEN